MNTEEQLTTYLSFQEWHDAWKKTTNSSDRCGLLHDLQENNAAYEENKAVPFLLELANGFEKSSNLSIYMQSYQRHLKIVRKATTVLCIRFFKARMDHSSPSVNNRYWWWIFSNPEAFTAVLNFFFPKGTAEVCNCPSPRTTKSTDFEENTILQFVREFVRECWCTGCPDGNMRPLIYAAKPQIISLLRYIEELPWLFGRELDVPCRKRLKEIALRENLRLPQRYVGQSTYRLPATIEEAVLGGSLAACILVANKVSRQQRFILRWRYIADSREHQERKKVNELQKIKQELERIEAIKTRLNRELGMGA